jgi:N-acetyl-gamma-glutamyl-phosphate reductase
MTDKIGIILVGGTGYGAKEFIRLSLNHPKLELAQIYSRSESDHSIDSIHRELSHLTHLKFSSALDLDILSKYEHKFFVLGLPHGESQNFIELHFEECKINNIHIIDLSGDFRIKEKTVRELWYPTKTTINEDVFNSFTYGLSEINKESIKTATHIANPGCFATGAIISLYPLTKNLSAEIVNISVDGKSGSSGGGKSPKSAFHHPELNGSAFSYSALNHRHEAEMKECLNIQDNSSFAFAPHVIPISRGMLVSSYIFMKTEISEDRINSLFKQEYENSPFVRLLNSPPEIRLVAGSNFIDLHVVARKNVISVTACLDNLVKGMAGQAIQNINLMSGEDEKLGLNLAPLGLI